MKPKQIFISILAVLFVFPLMGTFAQQAANSGSIEVITTFVYPGTVISTQPQKINERGDIVGIFDRFEPSDARFCPVQQW